MPGFSLSKSEERLMNFLWSENTPLSALEMVEKLRDQDWGEHYLRVVLKSLERKGAVECCGFEQRVNQYARRFCCALTKEEYYVQLAARGGVDPDSLLRTAAVAIVKKDKEIGKEELFKILEDIIEKYRAEGEEEEDKKEKEKKK